MQGLSAATVLEVWERGSSQAPLERALQLASVGCPGTPRDALLALSIGRRDAALFALREQLFGAEMTGVTACPSCGEGVEVTVNAADVRGACEAAPELPGVVSVDGYEVSFRTPNTEDLLTASAEVPAERREFILRRCLLSVRRPGEGDGEGPLPSEVVEAVTDAMAKADPLADIQLTLCCPPCGHRWRAAFDIVSFLWSEIEVAAGRLMHEVHRLASAYGWSERDILALSAARRQFYLAMVGE